MFCHTSRVKSHHLTIENPERVHLQIKIKISKAQILGPSDVSSTTFEGRERTYHPHPAKLPHPRKPECTLKSPNAAVWACDEAKLVRFVNFKRADKLWSALDQLQTTALITFIDDNMSQLWIIKPNNFAAVINDQFWQCLETWKGIRNMKISTLGQIITSSLSPPHA